MNIFDYQNDSLFLSDRIAQMPKKGRGAIAHMAKAAGVHPSLISQVLNEARDLNLEQAQALGEFIDLAAAELEYFLHLVQWKRAGTQKLRHYFQAKLDQLRVSASELEAQIKQDRHLHEVEKAIFYSHWHFSAIWIFTSLDEGKSINEVATRFQLSRERTVEILDFLLATQLCNFENGKYKMGPHSVHLERGSPFLARYHSNWRLRAIDASDKVGNDELMYTAPISLSTSDCKKLKKKLTDLIKEVTETAIASDPEEMRCFNLDFFKI